MTDPTDIPTADGAPHGSREDSGSRRRRVVVVTGASGGIGRAAARKFARRKDAVAAAGDAITAELGPIDVWVNVAFASVFAPFSEIKPEEFRRATQVSYLGFVHGTRVALDHMRPRDCGTIVQVGSALGERSIPLQSAYCGAKHAINGFTSSLRIELRHEHSGVQVTVVQMPAVNTPQFDWVRSRLPRHPQPVPPIFQPEMAADAIVFASEHPRRKQYWVGTSTALTVLANRVAPALLDRTGFASQQTDEPAGSDRSGNLWLPLDGPAGHDFGAHGDFDERAHGTDPQLALSRHRGLAWAGLGTATLGALGWRGARAALRHTR